MRWRIVKLANAPFGQRVLRRGMQGGDVKLLQEKLVEHGFYCETVDGEFGVLTEEAVKLFQKTFRLKTDGIVGAVVYRTLQQIAVKSGRIIYTVQKGDQLEALARQYGVSTAAWRSIPDRRSALKRIYPGMKLLVYQKALFDWEEQSPKVEKDSKLTGRIDAKLKINAAGELESDIPEGQAGFYYLVKGDPEVWEQCLVSKKFCEKVADNFKQIKRLKWGIDLTGMPGGAYLNWNPLIGAVLKTVNLPQIPVILLPMEVGAQGVNTAFWRNLDWVSRVARLIMVEPLYDARSLEDFVAAVRQAEKGIARFGAWGALRQILLVVSTQGWNWDGETGMRRVSFKEVKLLRAMYARTMAESLNNQFNLIRYLSQGRQQCLVYRAQSSWCGLLEQIIKYNFSGIVIRDFRGLGKEGPELIADTFAILPEVTER